MNSDEIHKKLIKIKIFKGVFSRDNIVKLSKRPLAFVINTDSKYEPGEHWVAILLLDGGRGEYFDPFGLPPLHDDFSNYLDCACPNGWIWSNLALQDPVDSSCGDWCIQYIRACTLGISLVDFLLLNSEHLLKNN